MTDMSSDNRRLWYATNLSSLDHLSLHLEPKTLKPSWDLCKTAHVSRYGTEQDSGSTEKYRHNLPGLISKYGVDWPCKAGSLTLRRSCWSNSRTNKVKRRAWQRERTPADDHNVQTDDWRYCIGVQSRPDSLKCDGRRRTTLHHALVRVAISYNTKEPAENISKPFMDHTWSSNIQKANSWPINYNWIWLNNFDEQLFTQVLRKAWLFPRAQTSMPLTEMVF